VLTDPMWSARASPVSFAGPRRFVEPGVTLSALPAIDAAIISHNHYDHLDRQTVRVLAATQPDIQWVAPLGLATILRKWGVTRVQELDWWQESRIATAVGELVAVPVPAQHFSARGLGDRFKTLWCSWVIAANGFRVFFGGDTAYHPEFGDIGLHYGPFDLLMLPVGAYEPRWFMHTVHMNPPEAMRAYGELSARNSMPPIMLPIHWGTFRLTDESMHEPPEWTQQLWRDAGHDAAKLWLLQHGETRTLRRAAAASW